MLLGLKDIFIKGDPFQKTLEIKSMDSAVVRIGPNSDSIIF